MRILQIGPLPPPQGGIATYIKSLQDMFSLDKETEIYVYNTSKGNNINFFKKTIINVVKFILYPFVLLKHSPDIIHSHLATGKGFWQIIIYVFITRLIKPTKDRPKIIGHLHGGEFESYYNKSSVVIKKIYNYVLNNYFDILICLSKKWFTFYSMIVDKRRLIILNNFYDIDRNLRKEDLINKNKKDRIDYLFLANLKSNKGINELICAFADALKCSLNKNFYLHIIGNGEEYSKILKLVNNSILKKHVYIYGALSGEQKIKIMEVCDFYILPSYNEGLPISLLESMYMGLFPIVSNVGSIPEIIVNEHNGLIIEPGNVLDIMDKIIYANEIYENDFDKYKNVIINNFLLVTNRYSKEKAYNKLKELYLSL